MKYKLIKEYPGSPKLGTITPWTWDTYPEFWEPVKEPEFKVLEEIYIPGHRCSGTPELMGDIKSVLRCSDNTVFNIGDRTNNGTISKMLKVDNMLRVYFEGKKAYNINLNTLRHIESLTVTEDGIDLFEGDTYWAVENENVFTGRAKKKEGKYWNIIYDGNCLLFSTNEAAQKYIDLNKPRYSKQQILDIIDRDGDEFTDGECIDNLFKLINIC